jgi:hypothetical protein
MTHGAGCALDESTILLFDKHEAGFVFAQDLAEYLNNGMLAQIQICVAFHDVFNRLFFLIMGR